MRRKKDYPHRISDLKQAPGDLATIQALINTHDFERGVEELSSPGALADWLGRHGLAPEELELGEKHLKRALELRANLRRLIAAGDGTDAANRALERLNRLAAGLPLLVRFDPGNGVRFVPADQDFDGALGRILVIFAMARLDRSWRRLKVCPGPTCRAVFYDASKNRSAKWCSARRSGNRASARRSQRKSRKRFAEAMAAESRPAIPNSPVEPLPLSEELLSLAKLLES